MSVRKLAKEFYHAGRAGFFKDLVRDQNRSERRNSNLICHNIVKDPESSEGENFDLEDRVGWDDGVRVRHSLVERWLDSQVGKSYEEVKKNAFEKFNAKSEDGLQILSRWTDFFKENQEDRFQNYGMDENGNFVKKFGSRHHYRKKSYTTQEKREFCVFLDGRILFEKDGKWFWRTSTEGIWSCFLQWDGLQYFHFTNGYHKIDSQRRYIKNKKDFILSQDEHPMKKNLYWSYYEEGSVPHIHCDHWSEVEFPFGFSMISEVSPDELEIIQNAHPSFVKNCLEFYKKRFS